MQGRINAEILISGSSRALSHYDSRIIERATGLKTFNIGRNASQTDIQLALLKTYLKHNTRPRLVIHNLDSFCFEATHQIFDPGQYLPYLSEPEILNALLKIDPNVWKWKYVPLYGYTAQDMRLTWVLGIGGAIGVYPREDLFQGFHPDYRRWTGDFDQFKAHNMDGVWFPIESEAIRDFEELLALCRDKRIPVILVYSPVYYEMQALERNRNKIFAKLRRLSERYHAPIWDYCGLPMCRQRKLFYNSQHLNNEGAAVFSTDLANRLTEERPWEGKGFARQERDAVPH
jgi:hypothetical protein